MAPLVWEGAMGLDPRQRSLLELHLRHGFDHTEIALVLGVTGKSGDVTFAGLKGAVEDALGAHVMLKEGRRHCANLDALLSAGDHVEISPEIRRLVDAHAEARNVGSDAADSCRP